jgi:hypothetical protein
MGITWSSARYHADILKDLHAQSIVERRQLLLIPDFPTQPAVTHSSGNEAQEYDTAFWMSMPLGLDASQ